MKVFLFSAAILLACSSPLFAQIFPPELNWEVGLNGGYSVCTRPLGPPDSYRGTRTNVVWDYSARAAYNFTPHWQLNLDIGSRKWESYGNWAINGTFGKALNPQPVTFLIADRAISESFQMNYVIPFYTHFQVYNKANLYFGAMFGMVTTVNDGAQTISTYKSATDSGYKYVSKFDYNNGIGLSFGVQTGFTYYFVPKLGLNIELAVRYANIGTSATVDQHEMSRYYLLYFPETIGIRYKF